MIDRRGFLRGLVMSVTASGLILPTAAEALVMGDRYNRLVTALRAVVVSQQTLIDMRPSAPYDVPSHLRGHDIRRFKRDVDIQRNNQRAAFLPAHQANFDEYLRIIVEEFADMTPFKVDPEAAQLALSRVFMDPMQIDILSEDDLRRHEDAIVAVASMRMLFTKYWLSTLDTKIHGTPNWTIFQDRYAHLIMLDHRVVVKQHEEEVAWRARFGHRRV